MQANSESGTIDITERKLFEVFASIEGPGKKNSKTDYYKAVISQLPQNCQLEIGENVSLNSAIRKYKRKKDSRCSLSVLIEEARRFSCQLLLLRKVTKMKCLSL